MFGKLLYYKATMIVFGLFPCDGLHVFDVHKSGTALPDDLRHDSAVLSLYRTHSIMPCLVVWLLPRFTSLSHSHNLSANFSPSFSASLLFLASFHGFRFGRDMLCSGNVLFFLVLFHFIWGKTKLFGSVSLIVFLTLCLCDCPYEGH